MATDWPQEIETKYVRWTFGGDRITCNVNLATPTTDLITVKLYLNKVISTKHAKYVTMDIKNFYLGTQLDKYEYVKIPIKKYDKRSSNNTTYFTSPAIKT